MRRTMRIGLLGALGILFGAGTARAYLLLHETLTIPLDDGTTVNLILSDSRGLDPPEGPLQKIDMSYLEAEKQLDAAQLSAKYVDHSRNRFYWNSTSRVVKEEKVYYYLPPPPRVAVDEAGRPEFMFIKFVSDKADTAGGVSGGILHFLAEYGLTAGQEKELQRKLAEKVQGATLAGAVPMESGSEESSFKVVSATLESDDLTKKVVASGRAPLMPGLKVACAARLTAYGATLLEETLKKPTGDLSIMFSFAYTAHSPAFKGTVSYHWSKLKTNKEQYELRAKEKSEWEAGYWWFIPYASEKKVYSTREVQDVYDFMCQNELITISVTEGLADERVESIRTLFMDTMSTMFFDRAAGLEGDDEGLEPTISKVEAKPTGKDYRFSRYRSKTESAFVDRTLNLSWRLPVKVEYVTTGKISGAWYQKAKAEHGELFDEINLDDPFFQRRMILFNLDLDAAEIFEDVINFVTVEVRKTRTGGRDFTDSVTLDKEYLKKKGVSATLTYAKMRDDDPQAFEYKVRWSARGGADYPASPSWQKGSWEGVTLAPPVRPLKVEVETDLDDLKQNDIVRATVQLRYSRFGKPYVDNRPLHLSVAKGDAMQSMAIYKDIDRPDYEYQITYYHKTEGRKETKWAAGTADGYIYCVLPEELRKKKTAE